MSYKLSLLLLKISLVSLITGYTKLIIFYYDYVFPIIKHYSFGVDNAVPENRRSVRKRKSGCFGAPERPEAYVFF